MNCSFLVSALVALVFVIGCGGTPAADPSLAASYRVSLGVGGDSVVAGLMSRRIAVVRLTPGSTSTSDGGELILHWSAPAWSALFLGSENPSRTLELTIYDLPDGGGVTGRGIALTDAHCRALAAQIRIEMIPSSSPDPRTTPLYRGMRDSACLLQRRF